MNWIVIVILGIFTAGLIVFIIIRNQKDKNELVENLNKDYPHKRDEEGDIEFEEE